MKRGVVLNSVLARSAGPRLRCFLGIAIWAVLGLAGVGSLQAQIDLPGPERLTHVDGIVTNTAGKPVADAEVTLVRDGQVAFRTRTDQAGAFRFEHVTGHYTFRVGRSKYAPAAREIVVTDEIVTRLERKKLYVIVGPGACMDECSAVLTSKRDFDRAIREKSRH